MKHNIKRFICITQFYWWLHCWKLGFNFEYVDKKMQLIALLYRMRDNAMQIGLI